MQLIYYSFEFEALVHLDKIPTSPREVLRKVPRNFDSSLMPLKDPQPKKQHKNGTIHE